MSVSLVICCDPRLTYSRHRYPDSQNFGRSLRTMPFSKTVLTKIMNTFHLPRVYLEALCSGLGSAARFTKGTGHIETDQLGTVFSPKEAI